MLTVLPDRLGLGPGARVLDVGCGDGRHLRPMLRRDGITAIGLDLGADEVRTTREGLAAMAELDFGGGGASPGAGPWGAIRGSAYELPFAEASFDVVIASEVLEHLDEDGAALSELARVLRPGGVLAVSVPREGPEAVCWALSSEYRNAPGGHVRIYRRSALRRMIADSGFRIFGMHFAHGLHSPYWWLRCLVGPSNERFAPVRWYHELLVWDLMKRPVWTRVAEAVLAPLIGKSVVFYAWKPR